MQHLMRPRTTLYVNDWFKAISKLGFSENLLGGFINEQFEVNYRELPNPDNLRELCHEMIEESSNWFGHVYRPEYDTVGMELGEKIAAIRLFLNEGLANVLLVDDFLPYLQHLGVRDCIFLLLECMIRLQKIYSRGIASAVPEQALSRGTSAIAQLIRSNDLVYEISQMSFEENTIVID